jgi:hypothetical protein
MATLDIRNPSYNIIYTNDTYNFVVHHIIYTNDIYIIVHDDIYTQMCVCFQVPMNLIRYGVTVIYFSTCSVFSFQVDMNLIWYGVTVIHFTSRSVHMVWSSE